MTDRRGAGGASGGRPSRPATPADRVCQRCGRRITWRKKWERDWDSVRYCSKQCRRSGLSPFDQRLESLIVDRLAERRGNATICPSEVARIAATDAISPCDADSWRELMEPVRMAARRLVERGKLEIVQQGHVVDPSTAKGPIRLRRIQ